MDENNTDSPKLIDGPGAADSPQSLQSSASADVNCGNYLARTDSTKNLQSSAATNIDLDPTDKEMVSKLRGDAIGDTMYSETFVLKTLMQLSNVNWCRELEEDLCVLWDMTEEKDVCEFLFQYSYPSLACTTLARYRENRLVEIIVGIFANLLSSTCTKRVSEEELKIVLSLLNSDDTLILIQLVRFLHATAFMFDKIEFLNQEALNHLCYILENSTNEELLIQTLKVVAGLLDNMKLDSTVINGKLFESSLVAYQFVMNRNGGATKELRLETRGQQSATKYFIEIVCNLSSYVAHSEITLEHLPDKIEAFVAVVVQILEYFAVEENLLPISDELTFYVKAFSYIFRILELPYQSSILMAISKILFILLRNNSDEFCVFAELFCYQISVAELDEIKGDAKELATLKAVLVDIENKEINYYEFCYLHNVKKLLQQLQ